MLQTSSVTNITRIPQKYHWEPRPRDNRAAPGPGFTRDCRGLIADRWIWYSGGNFSLYSVAQQPHGQAARALNPQNLWLLSHTPDHARTPFVW
jgi:hypothetical protein